MTRRKIWKCNLYESSPFRDYWRSTPSLLDLRLPPASRSPSYHRSFWRSVFNSYITYCMFWNLIFQAGFTETNMSIILGVAPFLALFTVINLQTSKRGNFWTPQVPRMGQISDSCTSRWGRRRPFISLFSLLLVFSLLLLFLGESLSTEARWLRMVRWNFSIAIGLEDLLIGHIRLWNYSYFISHYVFKSFFLV